MFYFKGTVKRFVKAVKKKKKFKSLANALCYMISKNVALTNVAQYKTNPSCADHFIVILKINISKELANVKKIVT